MFKVHYLLTVISMMKKSDKPRKSHRCISEKDHLLMKSQKADTAGGILKVTIIIGGDSSVPPLPIKIFQGDKV